MKIKNNTKFFIFFCLLFLGFFAGTQKVEAANCTWLVPFQNIHCPGITYKDYAVKDKTVCIQQGLVSHVTGAECCCPTNLTITPPPVLTTSTVEKITATPTKPVATLNNPFDNLNIDIPGLYQSISCKKNADGTYTCPKVDCIKGDDNSTTCEVPWIAQYIIAIYNYALIIIGALAAVTIMAGGVIWLISGSNASRMKVAKEMIIGSVSGLVVMFSSYMIISVVNPDILIFKPLKIGYIPEVISDTSDVAISGEAGKNPFQDACVLARKGDYSKCIAYGESRPNNLVKTSDGKYYVTQATKEVLEKVFDCVKQKNGGKNPFTIKDAWRSAKGQLDAKKKWTDRGKPQNAAIPCCSNHGIGEAVDLAVEGGEMNWKYNNTSGLKECMNKNGFYANLNPAEPWHWSPTGR